MNALAERLRTAAEEIRDYPAPDGTLEAACLAVAEQLRTASVMAQNIEIAPIGGRPFHDSDDCGGGWLDGGEGDLCRHFDDAIALADAILGEATA